MQNISFGRVKYLKLHRTYLFFQGWIQVFSFKKAMILIDKTLIFQDYENYYYVKL